MAVSWRNMAPNALRTLAGCLLQRKRVLATSVCPLIAAVVHLLWLGDVADAQGLVGWQPRSARVHLADGDTLRRLSRFERMIVNERVDEALSVVEPLLGESHEGVVEWADGVYESVRTSIHRRIAAFAPADLAAYRLRVDSLAGSWYRQGVAMRDETLLQQIVDRAFCSRWGDDALDALGELAFQRGDALSAWAAWSRLHTATSSDAVVVYPDATISLAEARSRLALTALGAGQRRTAADQIAAITKASPSATGRLGGREIAYVSALRTMLDSADARPAPQRSGGDWTDYRADRLRSNVLRRGPKNAAHYAQTWSIELNSPVASEAPLTDSLVLLSARPQPTMFPAISEGRVYYCDSGDVCTAALDAEGEQC
ncbi:MAG: hypothetical protein AAF961_18530, partial [Planctomycetota bacterium]